MNRTRVSVALAACEGAHFVRAQLESIAAQSRRPDEVVICDDASIDDTAVIADAFAAAAPFAVRVERNSRRLGITANFERAISLCSGDVIFLADQDDVWMPDKIETLVGVFEDRPRVGAVFHDGMVVNTELEPLGYTLWKSLGFDGIEQHRVLTGRASEVFLRHVVAAGTTLAFRARYRDLALPFPALRSCHDAFLAFLISAVAEIAIVDRQLIQYRLHGDNQIGIQKLSLREQIEKAREQLATDAFGYAATFFGAARERLEARRAHVTPALAARIDDKIVHSERRAAMSPRLFDRAPDIAREALSGRYWRYSYGLKSVAQDLWLRG